MGLSCGARFAKFILVIFNLVVFLAGVAILAVGVWLLVNEDASKYFDIITADTSESLVKGACAMLIIVGAVALSIAFFGCCGAFKEHTCMLQTYAVILAILLCLQVAAGISAVVFKDKVEDTLEATMNTTVQDRYGHVDHEAVTDGWDYMQIEFTCCGSVSGPADWETSYWKENNNLTVPVSCCVLENGDINSPVDETACMSAATNSSLPGASDYIHTEGCSPALHKWFTDHLAIIIGVAFGLVAIQLASLLLVCLLKSRIRPDYQFIWPEYRGMYGEQSITDQHL